MKNLSSIICFVALLFCASNLTAQAALQTLTLSEKITRNIQLKTSHIYKISLKTGEFAFINVQQKGIDLEIETLAPNGEKLDSFDSLNGNNGDELVVIDAVEMGIYQIKVNPLGESKKVKSGMYDIELVSVQNTLSAHLDQVFAKLYQRNFIPGFAVSIVNPKEVLYTQNQGFADVEKEIPYTLETCQNVGSITKTFIGLSLMMLVEQGKITLDTEINSVLPFKVTNPHTPNQPITIRHLATHTAAIDDGDAYKKAYYMVDENFYRDKTYHKPVQKEINQMAKNSAMTLPDYLKAFFTPDGEFYSKKNFFKRPAGQEWYYSNVGASLAAYVVEVVSGQSYDDLVLKQIIQPLNLKNTSLGQQENTDIAYAFHYDKNFTQLPHVKTITYPDGEMYTNTNDLNSYLMHWMNGYRGEGQLLNPTSYQEIMQVQFEEKRGRFKGMKEGIFWAFGKGGKMGHSGGDYGVNALMFFYPEMNVGYTIIMNVMPSESDNALVEYRKIKKMIERYAPFFEEKVK